MPAERNTFKLGLSILLFLTLLVGVLLFLAPRGGGDLSLRVRFAHGDLTTPLKVGGQVVCGGQPVGTIRKLDLQEMEDPQTGARNLYSVAHVRVDGGLGLRRDCRVIPDGPLLGGPGRLIIIDRGVGDPVQPGDILEGRPAHGLSDLTRTLAGELDANNPASLIALLRGQLDAAAPDSLVHKLNLTLGDLSAVTHRLRTELDPQQQDVLITKLHGVLDNLSTAAGLMRTEVDAKNEAAAVARIHAVLDALGKGVDTMLAILNENREPIHETIRRMRNAGEILEQQVALRIARQLDPNEPAALLARVHVALDALGTSVRDLNTITSNTRDLVLTNREQINRMMANMKETSDHLKAASKEIRRNPWRLFYQPTLAEAERANVHDAARAFSEAATRLDDAVTRLQSMTGENVGAVEEQQLRELTEQLNRSFQNFTEAEKALWEQLNIR